MFGFSSGADTGKFEKSAPDPLDNGIMSKNPSVSGILSAISSRYGPSKVRRPRPDSSYTVHPFIGLRFNIRAYIVLRPPLFVSRVAQTTGTKERIRAEETTGTKERIVHADESGNTRSSLLLV